ncbi:MAG: hypothetical protein AAFY67_20070 [Cyanobacteria bacterium J06642_9]
MSPLKFSVELEAQGEIPLVCSHEWGHALRRCNRLLILNRRLIANDISQAVMKMANIQQAHGDLNVKAETPFFY